MLKKKLNILLIEDNQVDILRLKSAISKEEENFNLMLVSNGNEALNVLENSLPDIIILDLTLADTNGIEFLSIIKYNDAYKSIPVIVLTSLNSNEDIAECYKLGIAGYLLKPSLDEDYEAKINTILKYWSLNEFIPY